MGLLFQFPVEENNLDDRINVESGTITLKTYGLPMIFWGYLLALITLILFMFIAILGPIKKLISTTDALNQFLGYVVLCTLILLPFVLLSIFFYEKSISKIKNRITVIHKLFFITFKKTTYLIKKESGLFLDHFLDSPNMARIQNKENMAAFQNRGYYELFMECEDGRKIFLDRNSRPSELKKLKATLDKF